jgi:hypothetical protein
MNGDGVCQRGERWQAIVRVLQGTARDRGFCLSVFLGGLGKQLLLTLHGMEGLRSRTDAESRSPRTHERDFACISHNCTPASYHCKCPSSSDHRHAVSAHPVRIGAWFRAVLPRLNFISYVHATLAATIKAFRAAVASSGSLRVRRGLGSERKISVSTASADSTSTGFMIHLATGLSSAHCNQLILWRQPNYCMPAWIQLPAVTLSVQ